MNISGVLIHSKIDKSDTVTSQLKTINGVEIHAEKDDGRIIVTVEKESEHDLIETINTLQEIDGVISISMVYHHFDVLEPEPNRGLEAS